MDDLIRRDDALRIVKGAYVKSKDIDDFFALLLTSFENVLPSADYVPREKFEALKGSAKVLSDICFEKEYVVRCRGCKHYSLFENGVQGQCDRQICCVTFLDDYCSYGEED